MLELFYSIISSSFLFVLFKNFQLKKINTFQAIVINYFTAAVVGISLSAVEFNYDNTIGSDWFFGAILLGFLFISIFNLMAKTAQINGLSVASVASKMSVIIPVIFGFYVYKEEASFIKVIAILLALLAVYLASVKNESNIDLKKHLSYPILLFLGSGVIDTAIKFIETTYVPENGIPLFSATIFLIAGSIGIIISIAFKKTFGFKNDIRTIIAGIILGIVNYSSIYFLLSALNNESLESSSIFTINNVAIVMITSLIGLLFYKESLSKRNWFGISLAIISIILISAS